MSENPDGSKRRGRPSVQEKTKIDTLVAEYFQRGVTAAFVIQKTGLNKNTVYAKYKNLAEKLGQARDSDFFQRYRLEKLQFEISFDELAIKNYSILAKVEQKIADCNDDEILLQFLQKFLDITRNIVLIKREKRETAMKPNFDEELKTQIKEMIEENDKE